MANMSYCRFQNTGSDLEDCIHALEDAIENFIPKSVYDSHKEEYEKIENDLNGRDPTTDELERMAELEDIIQRYDNNKISKDEKRALKKMLENCTEFETLAEIYLESLEEDGEVIREDGE